MSVRAPKNPTVQHAGERNVNRIPFLTGNASAPIFAGEVASKEFVFTRSRHTRLLGSTPRTQKAFSLAAVSERRASKHAAALMPHSSPPSRLRFAVL
jgi:hypothetical protein